MIWLYLTWFYLVSVVLAGIATIFYLRYTLEEGNDVTVGDIVLNVFLCLIPIFNFVLALIGFTAGVARSNIWNKKVFRGR